MNLRSLTLGLLVTSCAALAAEYRVNSVAEWNSAVGRVAAGDEIILRDGEWQDAALAIRARGTEQQPIVIRAATPGKVVLSGRSTVDVDGEWIVVSGLLIRDGTGPASGIALRGKHNRLTESAMIGGTYKHFLRVFGTQQRVDHCTLMGKTSGEPTLQVESEAGGPNNDRVDHNYFGPRPPLGRNGGETIRVGYSGQSMNVSRTIVEQNLFEGCDGEIEIISSKSCENVYRWNTFLDCAGMLTLRHGNRCVVEGNFFLGHHKKESGGIRIIGEDHVVVNNYIDGVARGAFWITCGVPNSPLNGYFAAHRAMIVFNTIVDSDGPVFDCSNGLGQSGRTLKPDGVVIANNAVAVGAKGVLVTGGEGADWRWLGNVAAGTKASHPGLRYAEFALDRGGDGLARPRADSPLRGAAEGEFPKVAADIDGQPRTGAKDVGCDQASTAPVTNRPLTRADVGPAWLR